VKVEKDYEELLELFNKHKIKYCILGAYAIAFYARPRYTKDIDILVEPDVKNAQKIVKALKEFGFGDLKLNVKDFIRKNNVVQLGYEPLRIDIITSIEGNSFKSIWNGKSIGNYGKQKVFFIGLNELIKNKKSSKRKHDKDDLEVLLLVKKKI